MHNCKCPPRSGTVQYKFSRAQVLGGNNYQLEYCRNIFNIFIEVIQYHVDHLPPLRDPTVGGSSRDSNPGLDWVT